MENYWFTADRTGNFFSSDDSLTLIEEALGLNLSRDTDSTKEFSWSAKSHSKNCGLVEILD